MKPKNKFQEKIVEASKDLPKFTLSQIQWGYDNAIEYVGRRTDKGIIFYFLHKRFDDLQYRCFVDSCLFGNLSH